MSDSVLSETREQARAELVEAMAMAQHASWGQDAILRNWRAARRAEYGIILDALLRPELRVSLLTLLSADDEPCNHSSHQSGYHLCALPRGHDGFHRHVLIGGPLDHSVPVPVFVEENH